MMLAREVEKAHRDLKDIASNDNNKEEDQEDQDQVSSSLSEYNYMDQFVQSWKSKSKIYSEKKISNKKMQKKGTKKYTSPFPSAMDRQRAKVVLKGSATSAKDPILFQKKAMEGNEPDQNGNDVYGKDVYQTRRAFKMWIQYSKSTSSDALEHAAQEVESGEVHGLEHIPLASPGLRSTCMCMSIVLLLLWISRSTGSPFALPGKVENKVTNDLLLDSESYGKIQVMEEKKLMELEDDFSLNTPAEEVIEEPETFEILSSEVLIEVPAIAEGLEATNLIADVEKELLIVYPFPFRGKLENSESSSNASLEVLDGSEPLQEIEEEENYLAKGNTPKGAYLEMVELLLGEFGLESSDTEELIEVPTIAQSPDVDELIKVLAFAQSLDDDELIEFPAIVESFVADELIDLPAITESPAIDELIELSAIPKGPSVENVVGLSAITKSHDADKVIDLPFIAGSLSSDNLPTIADSPDV